MSAKGQCICPNLRWPSQNKMCAKKNNILQLILYILYTKHVIFYLPFPITDTVSIFRVSAFIFLTLTPNILYPLYCHSTSSSVPSIALHLQNFLKTLHYHTWWDALTCCFDPHWLNNTFIFLALWTYFNLWRFTIFSTDGVSGVKNFKYVCSGFLSCVCIMIIGHLNSFI